jgi:hypothetical protein
LDLSLRLLGLGVGHREFCFILIDHAETGLKYGQLSNQELGRVAFF